VGRRRAGRCWAGGGGGRGVAGPGADWGVEAEAGGLALAGASKFGVRRRPGSNNQGGGREGKGDERCTRAEAGASESRCGGRTGQEGWRRARGSWRRGSESSERGRGKARGIFL
jgi:hypothetical protein